MGKLVEYSPLLFGSAFVNISLALLSLFLAIILGGLGARAKLSEGRLGLWFVNGYTAIVRGIPDLVMVLLVYFGVQGLVNDLGVALGTWESLNLSPFLSGTLTIGFIYGAYLTETFRGAYLAIPRGQGQASTALGLSGSKRLFLVILPQFIRHALPGFANVWLVLVKSTAIVSVINIKDLVWLANTAGKSTREPFYFFLAVILFYLAITAVSGWLFAWLEKRYRIGD